MRTDTPQVGYAPYRQVHAHSTGNPNSTAQNEADYMQRKDLGSRFIVRRYLETIIEDDVIAVDNHWTTSGGHCLLPFKWLDELLLFQVVSRELSTDSSLILRNTLEHLCRCHTSIEHCKDIGRCKEPCIMSPNVVVNYTFVFATKGSNQREIFLSTAAKECQHINININDDLIKCQHRAIEVFLCFYV